MCRLRWAFRAAASHVEAAEHSPLVRQLPQGEIGKTAGRTPGLLLPAPLDVPLDVAAEALALTCPPCLPAAARAHGLEAKEVQGFIWVVPFLAACADLSALAIQPTAGAAGQVAIELAGGGTGGGAAEVVAWLACTAELQHGHENVCRHQRSA